MHSERENGLQYLMEIMLESLMVSKRREYLQEEGLAGTSATATVQAGHTGTDGH